MDPDDKGSANSADSPKNRPTNEVGRLHVPGHRPTYYHPNSVQATSVVPSESKNHPTSEPEPGHEPSSPKPKFEPVAPDYYKNKGGKSRWIFLAIVALLIVGAVFYWFVLKPKPAKVPTTTSVSGNSQASQISSSTTHYDSSNLNLGFDYPQDWKVNDATGSGALTVTSPTMKLKTVGGQQVDGQIIMAIRTQTQNLPEFSKGNATAVLDSQKITYTKPTQTQRANTYISFLNYASSKATGIDGIYITGDNGYQKNQAIPQVDVSKANPLVDITFASNNKAITIATSSWSDNSFSKPLTSMLESLSLQ